MFIAFLLGFVIGWVVLLCSPLLQPDLDFPQVHQLDLVTFIPTDDHHDLTNEPIPSKYFRKWNQNSRKESFIIRCLGNNGQKQNYKVVNGLPQDEIRAFQKKHPIPFFVHSDGYQPIENTHYSPTRSILKTKLAPGILVSVGYPCDFWWNYRSFNYAQTQDVNTLRLTIQQLLAICPDSRVQLSANSKGALTTLHFLAEIAEKNEVYPISRAFLFSPILDFQSSSYGMGKLSGWLLRFAAPRLMPNYNLRERQLQDVFSFPNLPIFVSSLRNDSFVDVEKVEVMLNHFLKVGPIEKGNVTHFICEDATLIHGQIGKSEAHQEALERFLSGTGNTQIIVR
jgi:hypothetical protein